jgi:hypothetical protein
MCRGQRLSVHVQQRALHRRLSRAGRGLRVHVQQRALHRRLSRDISSAGGCV